MLYDSAQAMWDKLKNAYEGDEKVKKSKLQTHRMQFESLKMKEDENVTPYFLRVDEVVNSLKGLGEKVDDSLVIQKILRFLLLRFDAKISAIEEMVNCHVPFSKIKLTIYSRPVCPKLVSQVL